MEGNRGGVAGGAGGQRGNGGEGLGGKEGKETVVRMLMLLLLLIVIIIMILMILKKQPGHADPLQCTLQSSLKQLPSDKGSARPASLTSHSPSGSALCVIFMTSRRRK